MNCRPSASTTSPNNSFFGPDVSRASVSALDAVRILCHALTALTILHILSHPTMVSFFSALSFQDTAVTYLLAPVVIIACVGYLFSETRRLRIDLTQLLLLHNDTSNSNSNSSRHVNFFGSSRSVMAQFAAQAQQASVPSSSSDNNNNTDIQQQQQQLDHPELSMCSEHKESMQRLFDDARWKEINVLPDGTRVFDLPNGDPISPFRIKGTLRCPLKKMADYIWSADLPLKKQLSPDLLELSILKEPNPNVRIEYQRCDTPRFVANRDMLYLKTRHDLGNGVVGFSLVSLPDHVKPSNAPQGAGCVRASMAAFWRLQPRGDGGGIDIDFCVKVDVGGYIPKAIINTYKTSEPVKFLNNLKRFMESGNNNDNNNNINEPESQ
eukprot:PhM_4_TR13684/c2_g1_i2/m.75359